MKKGKSLIKEKNAFYGFLGYTAFSAGIVTLNPVLCCGLYGPAHALFPHLPDHPSPGGGLYRGIPRLK